MIIKHCQVQRGVLILENWSQRQMSNVMVMMAEKILIGMVQDGTEWLDKQGLNLVKPHMMSMEIGVMHATPTMVAGLLEVTQALLEKLSLGQYVIIQNIAGVWKRLRLK